MKMIFTSEDSVYLHHLKNMLEAKQIDCIIKNDRLGSIAGEVPVGVCWPELWVRDAIHETWARELIAESQKYAEENKNWICEDCGEEHSSRFTDCWNCQSIKAF